MEAIINFKGTNEEFEVFLDFILWECECDEIVVADVAFFRRFARRLAILARRGGALIRSL